MVEMVVLIVVALLLRRREASDVGLKSLVHVHVFHVE